jgi:hypothetical protein
MLAAAGVFSSFSNAPPTTPVPSNTMAMADEAAAAGAVSVGTTSVAMLLGGDGIAAEAAPTAAVPASSTALMQ